MTISIGADHAGFLVKNRIAEHLARTGHEVVDTRHGQRGLAAITRISPRLWRTTS